jgi:hypothetical protein
MDGTKLERVGTVREHRTDASHHGSAIDKVFDAEEERRDMHCNQ